MVQKMQPPATPLKILLLDPIIIAITMDVITMDNLREVPSLKMPPPMMPTAKVVLPFQEMKQISLLFMVEEM